MQHPLRRRRQINALTISTSGSPPPAKTAATITRARSRSNRRFAPAASETRGGGWGRWSGADLIDRTLSTMYGHGFSTAIQGEECTENQFSAPKEH